MTSMLINTTTKRLSRMPNTPNGQLFYVPVKPFAQMELATKHCKDS